jgi:Uma2 family endonuclease
MPIFLIESPSAPPTPGPPRKRWTRAEFEALEKTGILDQQRVELIEGELISKMGDGRPHVIALSLICPWLADAFGRRFVNLAAPIDVAPEDNPTNEPEPDAIVMNRDLSNFQSANPRPEDLHLVVEVSDTTLQFDLTSKAALYARARIVEYWVVDVQGRRLIVHREPGHGRYANVAVYNESESIAPLGAPHAQFRLADVLSS